MTAPAIADLGFGGASLGNLYHQVADDDAQATLEAAWQGGIRRYDTAPHYGLGLSERRLGEFLRGKPRDQFNISTKVGRLLRPNADPAPGSDLDNGFDVVADQVRVFDPSEAGIRATLEGSLERLGLDRVDTLYLHDPDVYDLDRGLAEGLPALAKLRAEGLVGRIGIGTNTVAAALAAVRAGDLDVVMIAGRLTLLEQPALAELLPLCVERGVGVVAVGVFNSGLLSTSSPAAGGRYDYGTVPADLLARAVALADECRAAGIELPVAALQYPLRHPGVESVVVGAGRPAHIVENLERWATDIPESFWEQLASKGLIP